eukprot:CAMPEP_0185799252 /NCGR_PEP_ID=MMETSP1322-20130828/206_1 /TAXON_ID=265543 /ORGANISM="Minutocellus polymorphus, Strain RCC2270" /LENGTH=286 /DNA_ID=CAMNT_0028494807 /DNA_START=17 /DNA_END=877 /DNA_ORIENTATION=+
MLATATARTCSGHVLRRLTVAAALVSVGLPVNAFVLTPHGPLRQSSPSSPPLHSHQTRLFSSRRGYDWDPDEDQPKKEKNALAEKVKSLVPGSVKKWFRSDDEKRAALERKRRQNEISGALDQSLKDAPLGVRLLGKAAGKIFSKVASGLAESMEEQSRQMEGLLQDARSFIVEDGTASNLLGDPIAIGAPFSQSSSTSVINGAKTVSVQASFEVSGSRSSGIATMVANESGVQRLRLDVAGQSFEVDTRGGRRIGGGGRGNAPKTGPKKGDIIDAEIIDAEYREK